jgi:cell division septation protein DedD
MNKGWSSFMDRRVKERLVGATILVVLIVLIVPELLSGPKRPANLPPPAAVVAPAEPVRNVTVDLATSKATPEEEAAASAASAPPVESSPAAAPPSGSDVRTGSESAPSDEPAPGAGAHAATPPTVTTLKAQQPAAPALENEGSPPRSPSVMSKSPAARETSGAARETVPDSPHHGWAVQLGSFASHANAEKLVHELKAHDSSAYVSSSGSGASLRYRVRIGPLPDRGAALRVQLKLKKEGRSASLVPP